MNENSPTPEFVENSINLASPRLGSEAIYATDEFFAPKERMLRDEAAVFYPDKYDDNGKWMDGWESRRRRDAGHDFCVVRLGVKGVIKGVDIDTSYFTGNYPPAGSIEACVSNGSPKEDADWTQIVPPTSLGGNQHNYIPVNSEQAFNYLRVHMLPDGGIARLRIYGNPVCELASTDDVIELSSVLNGGRIVAFNDSHYGDPWVILTPGRGVNMGDGWETRRRREPGNDWIIIALGHAGDIDSIEVDTAHFKGNYPDKCSVQAAFITASTDLSLITQSMFWPVIMDEQKLGMDKQHTFKGSLIKQAGPVSHIRLNIHPDGGISRFRIMGRPAKT